MRWIASIAPADWVIFGIALGCAALAMARGWLRLGAGPPRPAGFAPPLALALVLAMVILEAIGALAGRAAIGPSAITRPLDLPAIVILGVGAYGLQATIIPVYVRLSRRERSVVVRGHAPATVGIAIAALALSYPIVMAVTSLAGLITTRITGEALEPLAHDTLRLLQASHWDGWALAMAGLVILAAPLTEEILYRGLIQQAVRALGAKPWTAIVITSAMFAAMHLGAAPLHAVAGLYIFSLALGWALERTGTLAAPILMHGLFNAVNIAMSFAVHEV